MTRDDRPYKLKNPAVRFFCPLCRTERGLSVHRDMKAKNYLHVVIISLLPMFFFFPLMKERVFIFPFFVWGSYEFFLKLLFRKNIPCPHCGFDATWYRRDVREAKERVQKFWKDKEIVEEK